MPALSCSSKFYTSILYNHLLLINLTETHQGSLDLLRLIVVWKCPIQHFHFIIYVPREKWKQTKSPDKCNFAVVMLHFNSTIDLMCVQFKLISTAATEIYAEAKLKKLTKY